MTLFAIFDRNLVIFFEKTFKNQFSGRNKNFGEKPSDTNLTKSYLSTFGVKILENFLFSKISIDLDKVTALEMSYGLNLSFRSPQSIGEYSEKNSAFELQA